MLRNKNRNRDFMGYEPPMPPSQPSVSNLDPKDERLLDLSEMVGQLGGQNDMLNEDNRRLEDENGSLRKDNAILQERNTALQLSDSETRAGYKSGSQLVEEIEEALAEKKRNPK